SDKPFSPSIIPFSGVILRFSLAGRFSSGGKGGQSPPTESGPQFLAARSACWQACRSRGPSPREIELHPTASAASPLPVLTGNLFRSIFRFALLCDFENHVSTEQVNLLRQKSFVFSSGVADVACCARGRFSFFSSSQSVESHFLRIALTASSSVTSHLRQAARSAVTVGK